MAYGKAAERSGLEMRRLRQITAKLVSLAVREKSEQLLAKEIAAHLAMLEEDLCRQGLSPEEAKFAARRAFGGLERVKEEYRDQRGFVWPEQLWQDVHFSLRTLQKSPGFAMSAVLALALALGRTRRFFRSSMLSR